MRTRYRVSAGLIFFLAKATGVSCFFPSWVTSWASVPPIQSFKKDLACSWGVVQESAFHKLKKVLMPAASLMNLDPEGEFHLYTDASKILVSRDVIC